MLQVTDSQTVTLRPTQGGYQKPIQGTVKRITPRQIVVQVSDGIVTSEMRFCRETGDPLSATAKAFPRYKLTTTENQPCPQR